VGWRRSSDPAAEFGQPAADGQRVAVGDVVDAGFRGESGDGGRGGVFDVDEGPDARAVPNDGEFAIANLIGGGSFTVIPGAGSVEESVAKRSAGGWDTEKRRP